MRSVYYTTLNVISDIIVMEDIDTSVLRPILMASEDIIPMEKEELNEMALLDKE